MSKKDDAQSRRRRSDQDWRWLADRLPDDWFDGPPSVVVDREEITVVGTLTLPHRGSRGRCRAVGRHSSRRGHLPRGDPSKNGWRSRATLNTGTTARWRGASRSTGERYLFTHLAAPVMTRLRQPERQVLDTLVAAGVARSRADALAWCVRLVGEHSDDWLVQLREAMAEVEAVRASGPDR